jgi:hypothetical protein
MRQFFRAPGDRSARPQLLPRFRMQPAAAVWEWQPTDDLGLGRSPQRGGRHRIRRPQRLADPQHPGIAEHRVPWSAGANRSGLWLNLLHILVLDQRNRERVRVSTQSIPQAAPSSFRTHATTCASGRSAEDSDLPEMTRGRFGAARTAHRAWRAAAALGTQWKGRERRSPRDRSPAREVKLVDLLREAWAWSI